MTDAPPTPLAPSAKSPESPDMGALLARLEKSDFRSGFGLSLAMQDYARRKGQRVLGEHAARFIAERLAPAHPPKDGRQTPMKGHPVFLAQHACACCCRRCLGRWHNIPANRALTTAEQNFIIQLLLAWIAQKTGPGLGMEPKTTSSVPPEAPARHARAAMRRPKPMPKAQPPEQGYLF